ncbi:MAG: AarF/ABC1/UbiB kinase family protein [Rhizobiales bacterium]|nr:AarF/ABC1/UbiB kinase family protein [Hyphomicrobiales bacterium]
MTDEHDGEGNRLTSRVGRYAKVGTSVGGVAARMAGARLMGGNDRASEAKLLKEALGGLKGPLMKVAQLMATIPDALPAEYAKELAQLQSNAPAMGWPFVRRRMAAELGAGWQSKFASFEHDAAAAASLGQVHRATAHDGQALACKLQYPDMQSAVEADLTQLKMIFSVHRRMDPAIDTSEMSEEIGARLREELDYEREAGHMQLYTNVLADQPTVRIPGFRPELSTRRLLTMQWLDGRPLMEFTGAQLDVRNLLATQMFNVWWLPFCGYGLIHGDPHLGNYSAWLDDEGTPTGLNLLDFGCIRVFPPKFVAGVVALYHGLMADDRDQVVSAYETWGFEGLSNELIDILNIWARFIYGPMMEDKVRILADGGKAAEYGRSQAFTVHKALKEKGPVKVPREFVFMDRAAIGLGSVLLHLKAELNFYRLFNEALDKLSLDGVADRQAAELTKAGVKPAL